MKTIMREQDVEEQNVFSLCPFHSVWFATYGKNIMAGMAIPWLERECCHFMEFARYTVREQKRHEEPGIS